MLADKDEELDKLKGRKSTSSASQEMYENGSPSKKQAGPGAFITVPLDHQPTPGEKQLNLDYIKNVFIKYLEYQANSNEKEALTLEKVLFTVL